jgi:hypothetical protein
MNFSQVAFGRGFINSSKIKAHNAPVYNVDVSTGMPIVSKKKWIKKPLRKMNKS